MAAEYWSYGARGKRSDMQDEHGAGSCPHTAWLVFFVLDGHGGHGVVNALQPQMTNSIVAALQRVPLNKNTHSYDEAKLAAQLQMAVVGLDTRLYAELRGANRNSGSTLLVVTYNPLTRQLLQVNVGDSRSVVADLETGAIVSETKDHTLKDANEVQRVTSAGGTIVKNRVAGILSPPRAMGDMGIGLKRLSTPPSSSSSSRSR
jgi:serine/threonine protein phosphatase PrpC